MKTGELIQQLLVHGVHVIDRCPEAVMHHLDGVLETGLVVHKAQQER